MSRGFTLGYFNKVVVVVLLLICTSPMNVIEVKRYVVHTLFDKKVKV